MMNGSETRIPQYHGADEISTMGTNRQTRMHVHILPAFARRPLASLARCKQAACCGLHSAAELQQARRTVDLPVRSSAHDPVFVHLDHRSMGVGGDNSWYPNVVHEEYTVPASKPYKFRVCMKTLPPGVATPSVVRASS